MPIIILGIFLAHWQYQRNFWKKALIADLKEKIYQQPIALPQEITQKKRQGSLVFDAYQFTPMTLFGSFKTDLFFYRPTGGGVELITAFETEKGIIAVNAGKMPYGAKDLPIEKILPKDTMTIQGYYRLYQAPKQPSDAVLKKGDFIAKTPFNAFAALYKDAIISGALDINDKTMVSPYLKGKSNIFFLDKLVDHHLYYFYNWICMTLIALVVYVMLFIKEKS